MANILQSDAWARFQENLGHPTVRAEGDGWRYLATVEGGRGGRYLYTPYGPEADSPEAFQAALAHLQRTAAEHSCWFVRVEPANAVISHDPAESAEAAMHRQGMVRSPRALQPAHTQVVDLEQDLDAILKGMKSTNRNLYRNIHKKGVTFTSSTDPEDIGILLGFLDETARRNGFHRQQDDYLTEVARTLMPLDAAVLYVARLEGEPIGASLVYDSEDTRTYAHAAVDHAHRKLSAGIPLVVTMIVEAKEKGLKRFDLFGTAPEDAGPEHEWYGFTSFKKSFGGAPESYPGTWDLPVNALGYAAYQRVRAAREQASGLPGKVRALRGRLGRPAPEKAEG